jgi:excisionase family DNA binding protein
MSSTVDARQLISVQAAAGYTGLSAHTIYAMVSQRRIPHIKLGRLVKFDVPMLDEWIKKNTVMPMPYR